MVIWGEGDRAGRDAVACWSGCPWVALGRLPLPYFLRFISLFFGDVRGHGVGGVDVLFCGWGVQASGEVSEGACTAVFQGGRCGWCLGCGCCCGGRV